VNEVLCAVEAAGGNRSPTKAGIRMGGKKYMLTFSQDGFAKLVCSGGGACVGKTVTGVVVGLWSKEGKDSNGNFQNDEATYLIVKEMVDYLKGTGM